jgi:hypothetical protein
MDHLRNSDDDLFASSSESETECSKPTRLNFASVSLLDKHHFKRMSEQPTEASAILQDPNRDPGSSRKKSSSGLAATNDGQASNLTGRGFGELNAEEESKFREKLSKMVEKRQEKIQDIEKKMEVLSSHTKFKFALKFLLLKRFKWISHQFLFFQGKEEIFKLASMVDLRELKNEIEDEPCFHERVKMVLDFMVNLDMPNDPGLKTLDPVKTFFALLQILNVQFRLLHCCMFGKLTFQKRFKARLEKKGAIEEEPLPKGKKGRLSKFSDPRDRSPLTVLLKKILAVLEENSLALEISAHLSSSDFSTPRSFPGNLREELIQTINNKAFFGIYSFALNPIDADKVAICDLTVLLTEERVWAQTELNKISIGLEQTIALVTKKNEFLLEEDKVIIEERKTRRVPESNFEFRVSKIFTKKSILKRYQYIPPETKPTAYTHNEEPVYYKKDIMDLNSKFQYRLEGRQIKEGEVPLKIIPSFYDQEKHVELFSRDQTEVYIQKVADGQLPENEYGNIEVFNGIPEGCVHLDHKAIWRACKKLGVQYKVAVTGFERGPGYRLAAVKSGVVILKEHEKKVMKVFKKMKAEIEEKERKKQMDEVKKMWKSVLKTLLVKRYMSSRNS